MLEQQQQQLQQQQHIAKKIREHADNCFRFELRIVLFAHFY